MRNRKSFVYNLKEWFSLCKFFNLLSKLIPSTQESSMDLFHYIPFYIRNVLIFIWNITTLMLGFFLSFTAFHLADAGYDVWIGNVRGNSYCRSHESVSPTEQAFWEFRWEYFAQNRVGKSAKVHPLLVSHSRWIFFLFFCSFLYVRFFFTQKASVFSCCAIHRTRKRFDWITSNKIPKWYMREKNHNYGLG